MSRNWTDLTDRRAFIPDTIYLPREEFGDLLPLHRQQEPELWEKQVSADDAVTTQLDDDGWPISSSSAPWLMNAMLDALDLQPGLRVLEIGTGTGWNAAIMAAAGALVTTVEIDELIAGRAKSALARTGFSDVVVIHGDGELGVVSRSPFDRVIATAAAHTVPYQWVEQAAEGGRIVFPYTGEHHPRGLAVLTVSGKIASGQIIDEAAFMPLRGQRIDPAAFRAIGEPKPNVTIEVRPGGQYVSFDASLM